jgi:glutathione synthase/RimK-type ligase-like ATP-grasp enzyme
LADGLGIKRVIANKASKYEPKEGHIAINWGSSSHPLLKNFPGKVINPPALIRTAADKLAFFKVMSESKAPPRMPEWTQDPAKAVRWFKDGEEICARLKLSSHSGEGLAFFSDYQDNLDYCLGAKLFTKYVKKKDEYRVHILNGKVLDVQKKMLKRTDAHGNNVDPKQVDFRIRNLASGFVYGGRDAETPKDVLKQAELAMAASGLDFGAVDVLWNEKEKRAYVLEINTAPGITGTTLTNYINGMHEFLKELGGKDTIRKERTVVV